MNSHLKKSQLNPLKDEDVTKSSGYSKTQLLVRSHCGRLDYLSPFLGEILTHELGQASVQARQWSAQARENLGRNVDAYLKEELQLLPDRERMRHFSNQLDHLRLRLDRLRARTELLQSRLDKSLKNQHLSS